MTSPPPPRYYCVPMDAIGEISGLLGSFLKGLFSLLGKGGKIFLWGLCAVVILPCVFVAHVFYPLWTEWGKDF